MQKFFRDVSVNVTGSLVVILVGALGVWLASLTPSIALYAPISYLVVFLLTVALGTLIALAVGRARQVWLPPPVSASTGLKAYDDTKIREEVANLASLKKQIVEDYQRMSGLEVRTSDQIDQLKIEIRRREETIGSNIGALQDRIVQIDATYAGEIAELKRALDKHNRENIAHHSLNSDALRTRFDAVYRALGAMYHRERLLSLEQLLEDEATELAAPTQNLTTYDREQWGIWEAKERGWRRTLETWCDLANNYSPGIRDKVIAVSDDHYFQKGQATVDQFPDAEAYIAYKRFCALWKNWKNWQLEALRAVHQVAFNGGGRVPVDGAGDFEELGDRSR
ncbi:CvpA family protein [Sphingomonas mesophila]|uniref:CvpA family protein n=1 Tax=Sphingomonas mesophila TaxID=2303576 RepID=UPI000E5800E3|nr:CvpA family protein [Sphingomonas mesophila]